MLAPLFRSSGRLRLLLPVLAATSLTFQAPACARAPKDPLRALADEMAAAAEARDADAIAERLSQAFQGKGLGRADAVAMIRRYFAAYETIGVDIYSFEAERGDGAAHVRCEVDFRGEARKLGGLDGLLPPSAVYRFELDLADEGGTWRVRGASWDEVKPAGGS